MNKTAKNLFALADFIEKHAPPEQIDMRWFSKRNDVELGQDSPRNITPSDCGTTFCALGWEAVRVPKVAEQFGCWSLLMQSQFPALNARQTACCFGAGESSDKASVLERLRAAAEEVAAARE